MAGSVLVTVDNNKLTSIMLDSDGEVQDEFCIEKKKLEFLEL